MPEDQELQIGIRSKVSSKRPTVVTNDKFVKYVFVGWSLTPTSTDIAYLPGDDIISYDGQDKDLYAVWRISLSELNWQKDYLWKGTEYWDGGDHYVRDGSISNIRITEDTSGAIVEMTGNSINAGKGATWATFSSEFISIQEFQFTYHVNKGDSFNAVGFMFNVIDRGTYLEGYMFSINFDNAPLSIAGDTGAIFKFKYQKNANSTSFSRNELELVGSAFHINVSAARYSSTSGSMSIKVLSNGYEISGTEMSTVMFVPVNNPQPDTFGFVSDHYSHDCRQIGYYKIDNIKIIAVRDK